MNNLPFASPSETDFRRMLTNTIAKATIESAIRMAEAEGQVTINGRRGSGAHIWRLTAAITPIHERVINEAMRLVCNFSQKNKISFDTLINVTRDALVEFTHSLLKPCRVIANNGGMAESFLITEEVFNNKVNSALDDIKVGYINNNNIKERRLTVSEKAFWLLNALYDKVADDVMQDVKIKDVGHEVGMSDDDIKSAEAYLRKAGLFKYTDLAGMVEITLGGIREVEDVHRSPGQPTSHFPANVSIVIEGDMSTNTYNSTGQIGAVGPNAHVHDVTFQQAWDQSGINVALLAEELGRLRTAMKRESGDTPEQDEAIGAIAQAQKASVANDGPAALRALKGAGQWALDVAQKAAVPVAVEALKRALFT